MLSPFNNRLKKNYHYQKKLITSIAPHDMDFSPLISVIVPVYNTAPYLKKCLDSIRNQTYFNIEIICVNDGSTDNSLEILNEYATQDPRIIVITQNNSGQSSARNKALDIAKGEWITGVDSDDWIEPDTYEYFIKNIQTSDAKLAIFGVEVLNATKNRVIYYETYPDQEIKPTPHFIVNTSDWFWNKMWHRSIIEANNHRFPHNMWWEDVVFFTCISTYLPKILTLSKVKYHYMRYENGTSSLDTCRNFHPRNIEMLISVRLVLEFFKIHPIPEHMSSVGSLLLQKMYNFMANQVKIDTQQKAWDMLRGLVDEYNLLDNIRDFPLLTLQYNIAPSAFSALNKSYCSKYEIYKLTRKATLIADYSRLLRHYRLTQIKSFLAWGKKRKKYTEKRKKLKSLVREARAARRESRNQLFS